MDSPVSASPAVSYPLLTCSDGLAISRSESETGACYILKEPVSERFVRLGEIEYYIFQQLDGRTSFEQIQNRLKEKFDASLNINALNAFLNGLWKRGFLLLDGDETTNQAKKPGRIRGSVLYIRFKAFDPDRLFDVLIDKVRFFFTPYFVITSSILILLGFGTLVQNSEQLTYDMARLWQLKTLFIMWAIVLPVTVLHEFAHGLTCKNFGGKVREIGFLLLFFQPAMYCNVSDAWLFPDKNKRLWVGLAGVYFETFLWTLAILVWRITAPETLINYLSLIFIATSGLRIFFNLNPLIKLDGYYVLSDYLNVPNLRKRTFEYLGNGVRHFFGKETSDIGTVTRRERKIFSIYGPLAGVFTILFLGLIISRIGGYLIGNYQGIGFLLLTALLAMLFGRPVVKRYRKMTEKIGNDPEAQQPETRKRPNRIFKTFFKVALVSALFGVLFLGEIELKVAGEFTIYPTHNADVRAEIESIVETIHVEEGDQLKKGDLIARLSDRDYLAELRKTESQIMEKQAKLEKAREELKYAEGRLKKYHKLVNKQALSHDLLDNAEKEAHVKADEVKGTQAEIARLQAHSSYLKEQLELLDVVSPINGIVTTPKTSELVGILVEKGDLIVEVHQYQKVVAELNISEKDIADVKVGDEVVLKARAYPGESFTGKVTAIAPKMEANNRFAGKVIRVSTRIDNSDLLLKPDMTGQGKIYCGQRPAIDVVLRRFVRYFKVEFWSWW